MQLTITRGYKNKYFFIGVIEPSTLEIVRVKMFFNTAYNLKSVLYALLNDTTRLNRCGDTIKNRWIQHEKLLEY